MTTPAALARALRRLSLGVLFPLTACWSSGFTDAPSAQAKLRLQLSLRGVTRDIGPTAASVVVVSSQAALARSQVQSSNQVCKMDKTPTTTCELSVTEGSTVTMFATESDPSSSATLTPAQQSDTAGAQAFVEFAGWTSSCPMSMQPERGSCSYVVRGDTTIGVEFKPMLQVIVYQLGAAALDYAVSVPFATLKVPAQQQNILNLVGCKTILDSPPVPCDTVRAIGASPYRRLKIMLPKYASLGLFATNGTATQLQDWGPACTSVPSLCFEDDAHNAAFITPRLGDSTITRLTITLRYNYWQCPSGPSDSNRGGCTLVVP